MRRLGLLIVLAILPGLVLTGCLDATSGRPPPAGYPVPPYSSVVRTVTAASLGTSWRSGCPVGPSDLREVRVTYWGYDGEAHAGGVIVHRTVATQIATVFRKLYDARFQIRRIHPVTVYGSDDDRSMAANNTSAFNCRRVTGGTGWSEHAYGKAIDVNPVQNPYVTGSGVVLPPNGERWAHTRIDVPGMALPGKTLVNAFASIGWGWGGTWTSIKDYQHFSASGR